MVGLRPCRATLQAPPPPYNPGRDPFAPPRPPAPPAPPQSGRGGTPRGGTEGGVRPPGWGWGARRSMSIIIIYSIRRGSNPTTDILYRASARSRSCFRSGVFGCCLCGSKSESRPRHGREKPQWGTCFWAPSALGVTPRPQGPAHGAPRVVPAEGQKRSKIAPNPARSPLEWAPGLRKPTHNAATVGASCTAIFAAKVAMAEDF